MERTQHRRKRYRPALLIYRRCSICGNAFQTTRAHAQFDSARCKQRAYRLRVEERRKKRRKRRKVMAA